MTAQQTQTCSGPHLEEIVGRVRSGGTLLVGIGNTMFADDGAGPHLVYRLKGRTRATVLNAGDSLEAYLGKIAEAGEKTVVLVDAVDFGSSPGTVAIFTRDQLPSAASGTHRVPLGLIIDCLSRMCSAEVYLLGIQPGCTQLGADMTAAVGRSIECLAELLSDARRTGSSGRGVMI